MLEGVAEGVAARAEDRRPDEAAERVEQQEARPGEMIDPGEERGEGAQHGDEAAEEDDLAAVPLKQILRHLQPPLVDADVAPVAIDERKAELAPDPIAGVVAQDRRRRRAEDDENDVERAGGGEHRGADQRGFARHRHARALQRDKEEHGEIAVVRNETVRWWRNGIGGLAGGLRRRAKSSYRIGRAGVSRGRAGRRPGGRPPPSSMTTCVRELGGRP